MKHLGKMFGITSSDGVQKTDAEHGLGAIGKKKLSWTSFLIRNDFGMVAEKHEAVGRAPHFVRMA